MTACTNGICIETVNNNCIHIILCIYSYTWNTGSRELNTWILYTITMEYLKGILLNNYNSLSDIYVDLSDPYVDLSEKYLINYIA
jgi:hypothetical protein